jgi:hypothetical protein
VEQLEGKEATAENKSGDTPTTQQTEEPEETEP